MWPIRFIQMTRVCAVTQRRFASRGDHVDILALRKKNEKATNLNGVHVLSNQERTRDGTTEI